MNCTLYMYIMYFIILVIITISLQAVNYRQDILLALSIKEVTPQHCHIKLL